jgi:hypothetical protein
MEVIWHRFRPRDPTLLKDLGEGTASPVRARTESPAPAMRKARIAPGPAGSSPART